MPNVSISADSKQHVPGADIGSPPPKDCSFGAEDFRNAGEETLGPVGGYLLLLIKCLILSAVPVWLLWTVQTFSSELSVRINLNNQKAEGCVALKLPGEIWYSKTQMKEQGTAFAEMGGAARLPPKACIEIQGQTSCFLAKGARTPERNKHQFRDPLVPGLSQMLIGYVNWTRGLIPLNPSCSSMKRG